MLKVTLNYDGRFDGPEYSHPFWPRPEDNDVCAVCGLSRQGYTNGGSPMPDGNPHMKRGTFWLVALTTTDLRYAGDLGSSRLECPQCRSMHMILSTEPAYPGLGTGPGRSHRFGDPAHNKITCHECGFVHIERNDTTVKHDDNEENKP